jgi:hypothetical protein
MILMKITLLEATYSCKKMKPHKSVLELTLTRDDADLVAEKVQDHTIEAWYDDKKKMEEIIKKLTKVKDTLEQLQHTTMQQKEKEKQQQNYQERSVPK